MGSWKNWFLFTCVIIAIDLIGYYLVSCGFLGSLTANMVFLLIFFVGVIFAMTKLVKKHGFHGLNFRSIALPFLEKPADERALDRDHWGFFLFLGAEVALVRFLQSHTINICF